MPVYVFGLPFGRPTLGRSLFPGARLPTFPRAFLEESEVGPEMSFLSYPIRKSRAIMTLLSLALALQCRHSTSEEQGLFLIAYFLAGNPYASGNACFSSTNQEWSSEEAVTITGYSGNAMEPRVSHDLGVLFFNDKPATGDQDMDLHYAVKDAADATGRTYTHVGKLSGANRTGYLDGVAAIDENVNFYWISTRNYFTNYQTIFGGIFNPVALPPDVVSATVASADDAVSQRASGVLDMDMDVSHDGNWMVVSRATFAGNPYPESSRLAMFQLNPATRQASAYSDGVAQLENINATGCRAYAAALSNDRLELYYTVFSNPDAADDFHILVAKRSSVTDPFPAGARIGAIRGTLTEGPSLSKDGHYLFYHRKEGSSFRIYRVSR